MYASSKWTAPFSGCMILASWETSSIHSCLQSCEPLGIASPAWASAQNESFAIGKNRRYVFSTPLWLGRWSMDEIYLLYNCTLSHQQKTVHLLALVLLSFDSLFHGFCNGAAQFQLLRYRLQYHAVYFCKLQQSVQPILWPICIKFKHQPDSLQPKRC